ncbi:MAG: rhodanese-like domain-containing protein [Thermosynechococcaceae cyanobacterium]
MTTSITKKVELVEAATLKQWLDHDQVTLVDVRETDEYAGQHIPGAILVPLSKFDPTQIPNVANQQVVLYCRSGNRSVPAALTLLKLGYQDVSHLRGGLKSWVEQGYATEINERAPISLMRQVQIIVGALVLLSTLLGTFVSPWFLWLCGFMGGGLLFAGLTDTCVLARLLAKLPYNQPA